MRVLLVNPPSVGTDLSEVAPPLGLYSLARVVMRAGVDVQVWDANIEAKRRTDSGVYQEFSGVLEAFQPTVVGVTSMVVNTHVAAELARLAKDRCSETTTVAGGPHFSAFSLASRRTFPWIDYVIEGEGEAVFGALLEDLKAGRESLPRVLNASVSADLLAGIRPAFDTVPWAKYFAANSRRSVDYESSRGCIYKCAFCYSPEHWGARPRYLPDDTVIADLELLQRSGVRHVFFVDDNFLNDPARARRLCERIAESDIRLSWLCYATLNLLEPEMVKRLAIAGCDSVFVGVDAVADHAQRELRKRFFKGWEDALQRLRHCVSVGITPTCALIIRRDADEGELDELLAFAAALRQIGCAVRLNPLIGYQGTGFAPRADTAWYSEARVRLMLDDSPLLRENPFAAVEPHLFPYHCFTRDPKEELVHLRNVHAAATVIRHFPKAVQAVSQHGGGVWSRIRKISASAGIRTGVGLRRRERKAAMMALSEGLSSEGVAVVAREFAMTQLPKRRKWIRVSLLDRDRRWVVKVRPFVLDETGTAPRLLVAAFGDTVRTFELPLDSNRNELLRISKLLRARGRDVRQDVCVSSQTLSALVGADVVRTYLPKADGTTEYARPQE